VAALTLGPWIDVFIQRITLRIGYFSAFFARRRQELKP